MNAAYETFGFDWHGIAVSVRFCPDRCPAWREVHGHRLCHIEVESPGRQPLPITETGYRSMHVSSAVLDEWGGPLPYVMAALDMGACDPAWKERETNVQLALF